VPRLGEGRGGDSRGKMELWLPAGIRAGDETPLGSCRIRREVGRVSARAGRESQVSSFKIQGRLPLQT
jgi:hypothetical protein